MSANENPSNYDGGRERAYSRSSKESIQKSRASKFTGSKKVSFNNGFLSLFTENRM